MTQTNTRRLVRSMIACAIIAVTTISVSTITLATPALAAPALSAKTVGWVRVAHLSPDTRPVDVHITEDGHDTSTVNLDSVAYGAVSSYQSLNPGNYTVTMTRPGSRATSAPFAHLSVSVVGGQSTTVAAFGRNANLRLSAFSDDLATPAPGVARIRVIQASAVVPEVSVATSTGKAIATDARRGSATAYSDVPAGQWALLLSSAKHDFNTTVSLVSGSVTTLVVMDTARGGLIARPILDSAAAEQIPRGAVQTGGGFLARNGSAVIADHDKGHHTRWVPSSEVLR